MAIENARLYESSTRWLRQLESLNEIGHALASELELEPLLALVARRLRELVEARLVLIALPDGEQLRVAAAEGDGSYGVSGMQLELAALEGRARARARAQRARRLRARRPGDRPAGRAPARRPLRPRTSRSSCSGQGDRRA